MRLRLTVVGLVLGLTLGSGCTAATVPSPEPSTGATDGGTPSAGSASHSASASAKPTLDRDVTVALNPVNYGGTGVVVATFGDAVEGRPVDLEQKTDKGWTVVASGVQNGKGRVDFAAPYVKGATYRAVAREFAHDGKSLAPAVSRTTSRDQQWRLDFDEGFNGKSLSGRWSPRQTGDYFGARMCSAPYPSESKVGSGSWRGDVSKSSAARTRKVERAAPDGCPNGVWDAAMISTEGRYTFRYGVIAVRAKFPVQNGVHGSAWLQRTDTRGVEIDFIETFGPKYGIQHKVHYTKDGQSARLGGYVKSLPAVKTAEWWKDYHVFSVEWTPKEYVFRVDGVETFRTNEGISTGQQFIILSLLASDWELKRVVPGEMPATMSVDWVRVWQEKA